MIVFAKLVQNIISPLPIALVLLFVAILLVNRKRVISTLCLVLSFAILVFFSNRSVSYFLLSGLEAKFPSKSYSMYPKSSVIIALGGTLAPRFSGRANLEEVSGSRLIPTYLLYKMGKANKIIVSGGNPYRRTDDTERTEAEDMAEFLVDLGVPKTDILLDKESRNTEENALWVSKILKENKWTSSLLVTSAFHMKRAIQFFDHHGVSVIPVAVEHHASLDPRFPYLAAIPSAKALDMSALVIKEHLGFFWALTRN